MDSHYMHPSYAFQPYPHARDVVREPQVHARQTSHLQPNHFGEAQASRFSPEPMFKLAKCMTKEMRENQKLDLV